MIGKSRILTALLLLLLCFMHAEAQEMKMKFGGNFNINIDRDVIDYKNGSTKSDVNTNTFQIALKPKLYWYINENMQFGAFVGIGYGNLVTGLEGSGAGQTTTVNPDGSTTTTTSPIIGSGKSLGWSLTPYFGYKLFNLGKLDVWVEGSAYFGMYHKISEDKPGSTTVVSWNYEIFYGVQVMPVVDIALTETLALQVHAGVLALGFKGEKMFYEDYNRTTTSLDFHKGGLLGLLQSISDFGVGVVKRF